MTTGPADAASDGDARSLFGLFSFLLALSLILHRLWWSGFELEGLHFVVIVAAFWVLLRPRSVGRFLAMLALQVVSVAVDMPDVGDHTLLVGLVGACVLAYGSATTLGTRRPVTGGSLFVAIAPFLRTTVVVVYVAAALAKMNGTFLDPAVSCAAVMSSRLGALDPSQLAGDWQIGAVIWTTVIVEASLPVLLAIPRTRVAGLVAGVGFHLVLALAGNVPFTAVILAFYVAFLPADLPGRVRVLLDDGGRFTALRGRARGSMPPWAQPAALLGLVGTWLAGALLASSQPAIAESVIDTGTRAIVVALVLAAAAVALAFRRDGSRGGRTRATGSLRFAHPILVLGVCLVVLNAASPYLGLKTSSSFNMFSNLRTEAGRWNHAFIPEEVRIFGYQDELVRVVATDDGYLRKQGVDGYLLPRFELERYLRKHPGTTATYISPSSFETTTVRGDSSSRQVDQAGVGSPLGEIVDAVARFGAVPPAGQPGC